MDASLVDLKDVLAEADDLHIQTVDQLQLSRLGKRPVLKRTFGFVSILGFSCTVLISWEGYTVTLTQALNNGGPAGVVWSFLLNWIGVISTYLCLGELASMAPTAGGQYHWVALLSPEPVGEVLAYVTAWIAVAGWQAVVASNAYLIAVLIGGLASLGNPTFVADPWQTMLIYWALLLGAVIINTATSRALARFEGLILLIHLFGFFAVLVPLVYFGPRATASEVFLLKLNTGGWSSDSLSFLVGLPAAAFTLAGADCCVHMSEETHHASRNMPLALLLSILINGVLGFAMAIALMFCIGDLSTAISSEETLGFPFVYIYQNAVNSTAGTIILAAIIVVMGFCAIVGTSAAASRQLWSFARDNGVPFSRILYKLDSRTLIPVYTVLVTAGVSVLLSLVILGSSVAFEDLVNLSVAGLFSSYFLTCGLLLWRRCTKGIQPQDDRMAMESPVDLRWGPWRLPGLIGVANNSFACIYLAWTLFWSFWPPSNDVDASTMNFSSVVLGGVLILSLTWYILRARRTFKGPVRESEFET